MKILVLGASGFVGQNVVKYFNEQGIDVVAVSKNKNFDLLNLEDTKKHFNTIAPDYIINCAAHVGSLNYVTQHAAKVITDNSRMILNMYEALIHLAKKPIVINPIANCAYPATSNNFVEEEWWNGHLHQSVMAYGSTRRLMWSVAQSYEWQYQIKSINLLVPNMYGPFDSTDPNKAHALNALISKFVKAEKENKNEIEIWGTGIAIREWLYAEDFAKIVFQIINKNQLIGLEQPLNLAQNFGLSVKNLVEIINNSFANKFTVKWDSNMPDGAPRKVMDDNNFKKIFPNFIFQDFNTGISNSILYYTNKYPY